MVTVMLDPGHGESTPGKRSPDGTLREYAFNRDVARLVQSALTGLGITSSITVAGDEDMPLAARVERAVEGKSPLLVSIHANAGGGTGIETFYKLGSAGGQRLARLVQEELISATRMRNRGIKTNNLHMTREPETRGVTAILVELGFMDSGDLARLKRADYRLQCAAAIARGVYRHIHGHAPAEG